MNRLYDRFWGRILKILYIFAFMGIFILSFIAFMDASYEYYPAKYEWPSGGSMVLTKEAYTTYTYRQGAIAAAIVLISLLILLEIIRISVSYIIGYKTMGIWGILIKKLNLIHGFSSPKYEIK